MLLEEQKTYVYLEICKYLSREMNVIKILINNLEKDILFDNDLEKSIFDKVGNSMTNEYIKKYGNKESTSSEEDIRRYFNNNWVTFVTSFIEKINLSI